MELEDYSCVLCTASVEESLVHLFLHCSFAVRCWEWSHIQTFDQLDAYQNLEMIKEQL
jgi:hypothetical protein